MRVARSAKSEQQKLEEITPAIKDDHLAYGDSVRHDSEGEHYCNFKIPAGSELVLALHGSMRA